MQVPSGAPLCLSLAAQQLLTDHHQAPFQPPHVLGLRIHTLCIASVPWDEIGAFRGTIDWKRRTVRLLIGW
jgi:hypothetical protein